MGFEPTISAGERPKTYALDRAATGTGVLEHVKLTNTKLGLSFRLFPHIVCPIIAVLTYYIVRCTSNCNCLLTVAFACVAQLTFLSIHQFQFVRSFCVHNHQVKVYPSLVTKGLPNSPCCEMNTSNFLLWRNYAVYGLLNPHLCRILPHVYRFIDINGYLL